VASSFGAVQSGKPLDVEPTQRRLIAAGLALHQQGQAVMADRRFTEALELLQSAEVAFNAADASLLRAVDNVGLMLLDLVWCAYMLQVLHPSHFLHAAVRCFRRHLARWYQVPYFCFVGYIS
jgi:hypothetical protein